MTLTRTSKEILKVIYIIKFCFLIPIIKVIHTDCVLPFNEAKCDTVSISSCVSGWWSRQTKVIILGILPSFRVLCLGGHWEEFHIVIGSVHCNLRLSLKWYNWKIALDYIIRMFEAEIVVIILFNSFITKVKVLKLDFTNISVSGVAPFGLESRSLSWQVIALPITAYIYTLFLCYKICAINCHLVIHVERLSSPNGE